MEAVEKGLYGWFWSCPNGPKCIYRHALPPGFVLKKKQEKESKEQISFEEFIETEVWTTNFTMYGNKEVLIKWMDEVFVTPAEAKIKADNTYRDLDYSGHLKILV